MARLNISKRIQKEDYPKEYQDLVGRLALPLNQFIEQVVNIINNRNITVADNLPFEYKTLTFSVDASGFPTTVVRFPTILKKIQGLDVISASNGTSTPYPTTAPFASFSVNNGIITINHITGLTTGSEWTLNFIVYG